jgi:exopolysaccharide biosynthesis polyprenyl glycosylphosphotransferase
VALLTFRSYHLYSIKSPLSSIDEFINVVRAMGFVFLILMAATFVYREFTYSRIVLVITWLLSVVTLVMNRWLVRKLEHERRKKGRGETSVLVIGINRNSRTLIQRFRENPLYGRRIVGILSENSEEAGKHLEGIPILGRVEDFDEVIERFPVGEVVLADPELSRGKTSDIILKCESRMVSFKIVADFYGLVTSSVDIEYVSTVPLLGLKSLPLDDYWNRLLKRTFDLVLTIPAFLLALPFVAVLGVLIKVHDGGPIFYKQERMGQDGKIFTLYKFRTMRTGAETGTGPVWAKENDERRTPVGVFLRRYNFDELPQLWNVIRGEMSLVGPRPERPHFVDELREIVPRYMARHRVKSGLTGWAQVNGYRGNTSITERVKYDLYYMENWSLFLDLKILLMTPAAFSNAY